MGLFDIFDDANEQFKKDVSKAWDELWDNDSDDDDDNVQSSTSTDEILELFRKHGGPMVDGSGRTIPKIGDLLRVLPTGGSLEKFLVCDEVCNSLKPGTPVYCNLAVIAEHTGIYIGDNEIVHLSGDGNIEIVSPAEFVRRLDGVNPAISIYCASHKGKALGNNTIADRARSMVGSCRNYSVVFDNCHQFTCGCISGDFENPCNFFWMVEQEISDKLGSFTWAKWDY